MTDKKFKEKYNDGCIKAFKLLLMLYENDAEYKDVIEIFGINEKGDTQNVTLNKFLNALKVFGVKIQKKNNKYTIKNIPFSAKFDTDDLKALSIFESVIQELPDNKSQTVLRNFVDHIKRHLNSNSSAAYERIKTNNQNNYDFYYKNLKEQLADCEKYISQEFKLNLKYYDKNNEPKECFCTAKEIIYDNKQAYLKIYNSTCKDTESIPVQSIINISQMPTQKDKIPNTTTVAFRLKGRLAKTYVLKEGERISEYGKDGSILVINHAESTTQLLARLMRYDYDCKIEYPKNLQKQMQKMINDTLKIYE